MSSASHTSIIAGIDDRMIAITRLILAVAALLITSIDPSSPERFVSITYIALVLYVAYSSLLSIWAWRCHPKFPGTILHWVDVAWYVILIGLSSGTNSIFFFFFFFVILASSFRLGFRVGLQVTLVSTALFTLVGFLTLPADMAFEFNWFFLRPISLLVLGYMAAYWGGAEVESKRRLALLKDVSVLSNPRFGIDRMLDTLLERLRVFYDADTCLLVTHAPATARYHLRRADRQALYAAEKHLPIPEEMSHLFLALPGAQTLIYPTRFDLWGWWRWTACPAPVADDTTVWAEQLCGALGARSFITVPFDMNGERAGRLYIVSKRWHVFKISQVGFLLQILDHTAPVLENIRLVDQLASEAAEVERQRIARDLHDGIIQPYIGLQMGLAAIEQKLLLGRADVKAEITQLAHTTESAIADLRHYVRGLREGSEQEGGFLQAVRRFTEKFTAASGIVVHVEAEGDLPINDRLATELFHMIAEGVSNIRRHTSSPWARVALRRRQNHMLLCIENAVEEGPALPFTPRSLTERAAALGGRVCVEHTESGSMSVCIDIPL
jgi:signal transduction histidine kinase